MTTTRAEKALEKRKKLELEHERKLKENEDRQRMAEQRRARVQMNLPPGDRGDVTGHFCTLCTEKLLTQDVLNSHLQSDKHKNKVLDHEAEQKEERHSNNPSEESQDDVTANAGSENNHTTEGVGTENRGNDNKAQYVILLRDAERIHAVNFTLISPLYRTFVVPSFLQYDRPSDSHLNVFYFDNMTMIGPIIFVSRSFPARALTQRRKKKTHHFPKSFNIILTSCA